MTESLKERRAEGERLILAAFAAARDRGVGDWKRMTSAVLKNRLLTITNRAFDERRWDVSSFREFLALYPDLLSVDASEYPPIVELLRELEDQPARSGSEREMTPQRRVRPDLWRAVLDYSSGRAYVWDEDDEKAVPASPLDDPRPRLPSVGEAVYASWREEFSTRHAAKVSARDADALERWRLEGLPATRLPSPLRGLWNAELKIRVLDLLEEWFHEHQIAIPTDLVSTERRPAQAITQSTEAIRHLVLACVAVMTKDELQALKLPVSAVLRMRRE